MEKIDGSRPKVWKEQLMPDAFLLKRYFLILYLFIILFSFPISADNNKADKKVFVLTDISGIEDKSFNASIWNGLLSYYGESVKNQKNRGILYDTDVCSNLNECENQLLDLCRKQYDLIILAGFQFETSLKKIAPKFPDQRFAIIDAQVSGFDNVDSFVFNEEQGAFLVGALAALQSIEDNIHNPKFGFIGGIPGPVMTKFEMGYIQGIKSVLPNAVIVDYYVKSWSKPDSAKSKAREMYDDGVYCIFSAAGYSGTGVIMQAKEIRLSGKNVWVIGIDTDQFREGLYAGSKSAVLTSLIKKTDTASRLAIESISTAHNGNITVLSVSDNGVDYSRSNKVLKNSITAKIDRYKKDISEGRINIFTTYNETKNAGIAPQGLSAKD